MKRRTILITVLAAAALAGGCNKEEAKQETTPQQVDRLNNETRAAAPDPDNYTYAKRGEFVATMESQLAEINRDLDQLAAKIEKANDAAKAEATPKLEALRAQAAKLNDHLEQARNATESTWDDVKAGFKNGYSELKDGFQQARQWVSEKIAP